MCGALNLDEWAGVSDVRGRRQQIGGTVESGREDVLTNGDGNSAKRDGERQRRERGDVLRKWKTRLYV